MRLIDADDLINELTSFCEQQEDPKIKGIVTTVSLFVEIYALATSPIDISVVRCKDCKRWDGVPADETQDHECHLFDGNEEKIRIATPSYWFCPMGKRRTDDVQKTD